MSSNIRISKICLQCGNEFVAKTTVTKFCSHTCARRNYKQRKREEKANDLPPIETQKISFNQSRVENKEFLSIKEACALLGASRMTLYRLIKKKSIKAVKIGRRTIIKRSEIDKLFES